MARLNTHLSATPQPPPGPGARDSTVDSLYRDPTPRLRVRQSTARESTYSVMSPSQSNSDKENDQPDSREITPQPLAKGRRPMPAPAARLPTPSRSSSSQNGNKRRRTDDYNMGSPTQIYVDGDVAVEEQGEEAVDQDADDTIQAAEDEEMETKYYDPQQDPNVRRQLRANIRSHHREIEDNRDELIKPGNNALLDHVKRQDYYMGKVKQTADAALDSRVMVLASDLANRKVKNTLHGNTGVGIDVDQFVSRCIQFMRTGGHPEDEDVAPRASNRRQTGYEDEEDDTGEGLDWAVLGREACFPFNKRPPVTSFLLGPLSVQKKVRATQTRRARSQRQPTGPATRPQELTQADIKQSENTNLTHLVKGIKSRLERHIEVGSQKVEAELEEVEEEPDEEDVEAACRRHRVYQAPDSEPAVSLFDFVINPRSFGQTIENMFYVSFLIREGNVKVLMDDANEGLPLLVPSQPYSIQEQREHNVQKHQAVFTINWQTWKSLIDAFDIKEPLIPHRSAEETNVSAGGWYG